MKQKGHDSVRIAKDWLLREGYLEMAELFKETISDFEYVDTESLMFIE